MKCPELADLWNKKVDQWLPGAGMRKNGSCLIRSDKNVLEVGDGDFAQLCEYIENIEQYMLNG